MYHSRFYLTNIPTASHLKRIGFSIPLVINAYRLDKHTGKVIKGMVGRDQDSILVFAGYYVVYEVKGQTKSAMEVETLLKLIELCIHGQNSITSNLNSHLAETHLVNEINKRLITTRYDNLWDLLEHTPYNELFDCLKEVVGVYTTYPAILSELSHITGTINLSYTARRFPNHTPPIYPTQGMFPPYMAPHMPSPVPESSTQGEPVVYDVDEVMHVEMIGGRVSRLFTKDGGTIDINQPVISEGKLIPIEESLLSKREMVVDLLYKLYFGEVQCHAKLSAMNGRLGKDLLEIPLDEFIVIVTSATVKLTTEILTEQERTQLNGLLHDLIKQAIVDKQ